MDNIEDKKTVPCKRCNHPTVFNITNLCSICQSIEKSLLIYLSSPKAREYVRTLLAEYDKNYFDEKLKYSKRIYEEGR